VLTNKVRLLERSEPQVRPAWSRTSWCKSSHNPERREYVGKGKGARRNSQDLNVVSHLE